MITDYLRREASVMRSESFRALAFPTQIEAVSLTMRLVPFTPLCLVLSSVDKSFSPHSAV
jgi:hypothetical protein